MGAVRRVAKKLKRARAASPDAVDKVSFGLGQGVIVSVQPASLTATVLLGGSLTQVSGVPWLRAQAPTTGEVVWLLEHGTERMILGGIAHLNQDVPGDCLELYGATPFIDFHSGLGSSDYDARLINDATDQLSLMGALLYVVDNDARIRAAKIGQWAGGSSYAAFAHQGNYGTSGSYAMLQGDPGVEPDTYINCVNGRTIHFRNNNDSTDLMTLKLSAGVTEARFPKTLPALGGNTAIYVTSSQQLGYSTSDPKFKENAEALDAGGLDSPVFDLTPETWDWREDIASRSDIKARKLKGIGFRANKVEDLIPEATWGTLGKPTGLNNDTLLAFVVDGMKTLKNERDTMAAQLADALARIEALEAR